MKEGKKGKPVMGKMMKILAVVLMTLSISLGSVQAGLVTISGATQLEDVYLRGDNTQTSATYNYGGANLLVVGASTNATVKFNTLMRFTDFTAVSGQTVTGATLRLYNNNNAQQIANVTIDAYQIVAANGNWVEGTALGTNTTTGVSDWRYKIQNTGAWAGGVNGCGVAGTDYTTNLVGRTVSTNTTAEWINITLDASVVQNWITNPSQNYGIILTAPSATAGSGQVAYFNSSENALYGPELVLQVIPEPATIGMLGLGAFMTIILRRKRS